MKHFYAGHRMLVRWVMRGSLLARLPAAPKCEPRGLEPSKAAGMRAM